MKPEHSKIIELLKSYLEKNPEQRFGQAIFNLGINEFQKTTDPKNPNYTLRDIHNDGDKEILSRISRQITWFDLQSKVKDRVSKIEGFTGMTVNERLFATDLMDEFDTYKVSNKSYAEYILKALKVDRESISKTLGI